MKQKQQPIIEAVRLTKFVHGGQVLAHLPDSKTAFVWGGLPGELVDLHIIKRKRSISEAIVERVIEKSDDRIDAMEPDVYLSTSPWQIVSPKAENNAKQAILEELFAREQFECEWSPFISIGDDQNATTHYRNKMEFGFFGDDIGLHLAHYVRGTHGKRITIGSVLAKGPINTAAQAICEELNRLQIWGGDLKTIVVRCSQDGECVAALFVKKLDIDFSNFTLPSVCKGMDIYFSNPKSPASVATKKMLTLGNSTELKDSILGREIHYNVLSFFQVNVPVFEKALETINDWTNGLHKIDMYSGVGSIGVALEGTDLLVESDVNNIAMAKRNVDGQNIKVVHATSESALEYIDSLRAVIVDPPRAGLHDRVTERILDVLPPVVAYLSCNPSTQARDVARLHEKYDVVHAQGFNFFPRTPHIESLLILKRR